LQIPNILEIIYAPKKALKKLAEHPTVVAPILVLLIYVIANVGYYYTYASKVNLEQTVPAGTIDSEWTQNVTLWTSNVQNISLSDDFLNGTTYLISQYYGNSSLAFSTTNDTEVWMKLQGIGPINCTSPAAYDKLSFRLKWSGPSAKPFNVTIQLFSANSSDSFYKSLEPDFASSVDGQWNNETILLGAESNWSTSSSNAPDWSNIVGLKLDFTWQESSNITLQIDGVFFHGPLDSPINMYGTSLLFNVALSNILQFTITWIILAALVYLIAKFLGGKLVWRIILNPIGAILITLFILAVVNLIATSSLPNLNYSFELLSGFKGEPVTDSAYNTIIDQTQIATMVGMYAWYVIQVWTAVLCSVAVRVLAEFTWKKSILVGAMAYMICLIITSMLPF
jgi:hypothetical protein